MCELCGGSGRIQIVFGSVMVIRPCPNCNRAMKAARHDEFERMRGERCGTVRNNDEAGRKLAND